ncbi:MAG: VOC family protein [Proteobacteria bacterium]|nr:VOC family protein [Pseudomonadota bacterium]
MLDHVSLAITDREKSKTFYSATLETLGLRKVMDFGEAFAYGPSEEQPFFWLTETPKAGDPAGVHWAFRATDRAAVDKFHAAAVASGGADDGAPGLRDYHENYYAAFVLDPDGNRIEAVCHDPA